MLYSLHIPQSRREDSLWHVLEGLNNQSAFASELDGVKRLVLRVHANDWRAHLDLE